MAKDFKHIKNILLKKDILERLEKRSKYIHEEYQDYGLRLASKLEDLLHKTLYIKLAKDLPRNVMEKAVVFTLDYPLKSNKNSKKAKIFMWKLKGLCIEKGIKMPAPTRTYSKKIKAGKEQYKLLG